MRRSDPFPMVSRDLTTEEGILSYLQSGIYAEAKHVMSAHRLQGGASGFVYRAQLEDADLSSIIVKHVEGYAARAQQWKLDTNRMV
jgi:hypothetical protein